MSKEKLDAFQEERRQRILVVASKMLMERGIGRVSIKKISEAVDIPTASIKRYFASTADLVTLSAVYLIDNFYNEMRKRYADIGGESFTAYQEIEFFLDSFIYAFQHDKDFIKFTLDFDLYIKTQRVPQGTMDRYYASMSKFLIMFSEGFAKGEADGTVKSVLLKDDIFFACFHVMLAVVQKFSYGNTQPSPGGDDFAEIVLLKKMILDYLKPIDFPKENDEEK